MVVEGGWMDDVAVRQKLFGCGRGQVNKRPALRIAPSLFLLQRLGGQSANQRAEVRSRWTSHELEIHSSSISLWAQWLLSAI